MRCPCGYMMHILLTSWCWSDCEGGCCCRLLMPAAASVQVTAGSLPIASSFADISTHPPTINEITTDLVAKPGNVGVVKGLTHGPL